MLFKLYKGLKVVMDFASHAVIFAPVGVSLSVLPWVGQEYLSAEELQGLKAFALQLVTSV